MTQLFNNKNEKIDNITILDDLLKISKNNEDLYNLYKTRKSGLNKMEVTKLLELNGPNITVKEDKKPWFIIFLEAFKDQFILILTVLAVINFLLGDHLGSIIILSIGFVSALIRFIQDYSVIKFNRKLKSSIKSTTNVIRNAKEEEINVNKVVIGDIVTLSAGSIIPADVILVDAKDLFVNQAVFTGESVPVEKCIKSNKTTNIFNIDNICLMGSSVISGSGTGIVFQTGFNTYLGKMGKELIRKPEPNNFEKGMSNITKLLIKYMIVVSIAVFLINYFLRGNLEEAILFALSVAVGITPSMLPMIVNVNLTKGSRSLSKKKTLVKNINSIQNLGAIDILCTDKTGTLTQDKIILQKYININGDEDSSILEYAYLNSIYGTGMKNLIDRAIISYGKNHDIDSIITDYEKIDEIPFDYDRKLMSVVIRHDSVYRMITKGALEEVLKSCDKVKYNGKISPMNQGIIDTVKKCAENMARDGMQVIALASKRTSKWSTEFNKDSEKELTFIGFVAFLDPPKTDVKKTLNKLYSIGIKTKILTGDNPYATKNICHIVGLNDNVMEGYEIDKLTDKELLDRIENVDVFARMNPIQKERIVKLFKKNGHVVGYMGDGVNDSLSLHVADVGISVNSATDIAKEASDIILLEKNLDVIYNGVIEGRKVYGNIVKYMKMALSADFGDVFSILIASIFLPFLPLIPIQMLIQDFIYDISQIAIPYDNVDKEFLVKPRKWSTKGLSKFMNIMGVTSSIIDVLAFLIFWFILGYNSVDKAAYFQTAWFVECLTSELLIIHYVRTSKIPFIESRANPLLTILTFLMIILTIFTPIILNGVGNFDFVILPINYYLYIFLLVMLYSVIVQFIKKIYIKKYGEWL